MLPGHYAVALAAKRAAPETSLGTSVLAAQFLDLIWPILLLLDLEHVRIVPGLMAANSLEFVHYPISHSLLAAAGWSLLVGGAYLAIRNYPRGALVLGLLVLSHWFLDLPMHRPDLPLVPGDSVLVGGGLWNSLAATLAIEGILIAVALGIYLRSTRAVGRPGTWGLAAMIVLVATFFLGGIFGPPPADEQSLALAALGLWIFIPLGYWIDRYRVVKAEHPKR